MKAALLTNERYLIREGQAGATNEIRQERLGACPPVSAFGKLVGGESDSASLKAFF